MSSLVRTVAAAASGAATIYATDLLIQLCEGAMRDPAVGKLVGGGIFTLGGTFLVAKSGIFRIFINAVSQGESSGPKLTVTRTVAAASGATMVGVGLYSIVQGASELWERTFGCPKAEFPHAEYFPLASRSDCPLLESFVQELKSCPASSEMLHEMRQKKGLSFAVRQLPPYSEAQLDTSTNTLRFRSSALESDNRFNLGVEMLCKTKFSTDKAIQLHRDTRCKGVSFDQYLLRTADHEYASFSCRDAIVSACQGDYDAQSYANSTAVCPTFTEKWKDAVCGISAQKTKMMAIYNEWASIVGRRTGYRRPE